MSSGHEVSDGHDILLVSNCPVSKFIYTGSQAGEWQEQESGERDGQHDRFRDVMCAVEKGIRDLVSEKKRQPSGGSDEPLISGAICSALCAIHKRKQEFLCSRIAVLTASVDYPFFLTTQYMNFMNAYFTAQKMDVVIDVAVRKGSGSTDDSSSSILRQGCDITGGAYLSVPKPEALFQYLVVRLFVHCNGLL